MIEDVTPQQYNEILAELNTMDDSLAGLKHFNDLIQSVVKPGPTVGYVEFRNIVAMAKQRALKVSAAINAIDDKL